MHYCCLQRHLNTCSHAFAVHSAAIAQNKGGVADLLTTLENTNAVLAATKIALDATKADLDTTKTSLAATSTKLDGAAQVTTELTSKLGKSDTAAASFPLFF